MPEATICESSIALKTSYELMNQKLGSETKLWTNDVLVSFCETKVYLFQVFYQLNELHGCVSGIIEDMKKSLRSEIARLLSINQLNKSQATKSFGPGKANMPITGNSAMLR